jgi:hypothetical protein
MAFDNGGRKSVGTTIGFTPPITESFSASEEHSLCGGRTISGSKGGRVWPCYLLLRIAECLLVGVNVGVDFFEMIL